MTKGHLFLITLMTSIHIGFSQPHVFGVLSQAEIDMKAVSFDPDADAVVLFDLGESYFQDDSEYGYIIHHTRTRRIKIFQESAIAKFDKFEVPYYVGEDGRRENVVKLEAFTYNFENGKTTKVPLELSQVFDEKINENWWRKKFAFPSLKAGSIIEVRYVLETPYTHNLPDWKFQDRVPTLLSQVIVKMIPFYEYIYIAQGITKFDIQKSEVGSKERQWGSVTIQNGQKLGNGILFKEYIHTYGKVNVPAFKDESYITSVNDYIIKMDFQLAKIIRPTGGITTVMSTWNEIVESLDENEYFGQYIKKSEKYGNQLIKENPAINSNDPVEFVQYVKSNFQWNEYDGKYVSDDLKSLLQTKTGNAAQLNLLLCGLLRSAGMEAHPVILSTREHGKVDQNYPFNHFFNYVVVLVNTPTQQYLLDATDPLLPNHRIPSRCFNGSGLVVRVIKGSESVDWIQIENQLISSERVMMLSKIDLSNQQMISDISLHATEYTAHHYRKHFEDDPALLKEEMDKFGVEDITTFKTSNYDQASRPYLISFATENAIESIEENLLITPFLKFPIQFSGLTQKTRTYPIDFNYTKNKFYQNILDIPQEYIIKDTPERYELNNDLIHILYEVLVNGNTITCTGEYTIKKNVYSSSEYARIKAYLDTIARKFNQQIVLSKAQ